MQVSIFDPSDSDYSDSLQWLEDVHRIQVTPGALVELKGNEDWPVSVTVWPVNRIDARPQVYSRIDDDSPLSLQWSDAVVDCPNYPMPDSFWTIGWRGEYIHGHNETRPNGKRVEVIRAVGRVFPSLQSAKMFITKSQKWIDGPLSLQSRKA